MNKRVSEKEIQSGLDPELQVCLRNEGWCWAICHPLVQLLPYQESSAEYAHDMLRSKKQAVQQAADAGEWSRYLMLHEKPYRLQMLMEISGSLSDEEYWPLLGEMWVDIENVYQYRRYVRRLFNPAKRNAEQRPLLMTNDERAVLESLPETVTLYRGCGTRNKKGWSWTLDIEQARWFAKRFASVDCGSFSDLVLMGECAQSSIIAYFSTRNEDEIVIDPKDVTITDTIAVPVEEAGDDE